MTILPELEQQLFTAAEKLLPSSPDNEAPFVARGDKGSGSGTSRFRRGRRVAVSGLAAVWVAGAVATAAAAFDVFSAATGIQVHAGDPNAQAGGTGQEIALGAHDDVSVGIKFTRDIRFAPGYESWRAGTIAFETNLGGGAPIGHAYMSSSVLRFTVAESAACSWLYYYVAARATGNIAAATTAKAQVKAAPGWPAITGYNYPNELGLAVAAVDRGDAKLVQALINTNQVGNCLAIGPFPPAGLSEADRQEQLADARHAGQREIATDPVAHRLGINGIPTSQTPSAAPPPRG